MSLAVPLIWVSIISVGTGLYQGLKPSTYASLDDLDLSFAYSLVGFALSLLLVFKTNTSYARFWEGASWQEPRRLACVFMCTHTRPPRSARVSFGHFRDR